MIPANAEVLSAFASLADDPRFIRIHDWLIASRDARYSQLATIDDEIKLRQMQGEARNISDILRAEAEAREKRIPRSG